LYVYDPDASVYPYGPHYSDSHRQIDDERHFVGHLEPEISNVYQSR